MMEVAPLLWNELLRPVLHLAGSCSGAGERCVMVELLEVGALALGEFFLFLAQI
jgi:hypothetical protein